MNNKNKQTREQIHFSYKIINWVFSSVLHGILFTNDFIYLNLHNFFYFLFSVLFVGFKLNRGSDEIKSNFRKITEHFYLGIKF